MAKNDVWIRDSAPSMPVKRSKVAKGKTPTMIDVFRANVDPRRRRDFNDMLMIKEDKHATANLPKDVDNKLFPRSDEYGMRNYWMPE